MIIIIPNYARLGLALKDLREMRWDGSHIFRVWSFHKTIQNCLENNIETKVYNQSKFVWIFTLFWLLPDALPACFGCFLVFKIKHS